MNSSEQTEMNESNENVTKEEAEHALDGGLIRYYGLYWDRKHVNWWSSQILAIPIGKTGQGKTSANTKETWNCMNFWNQRGVYILYDESLHPVYAGQAGLERKNSTGRGSIGDRLSAHIEGKYRNGWAYFSWFGFMDTNTPNMRQATPKQRANPSWSEVKIKNINLNELLSSFEAIVIEGFIPRFNARGGDLRQAVRCEQYERFSEVEASRPLTFSARFLRTPAARLRRSAWLSRAYRLTFCSLAPILPPYPDVGRTSPLRLLWPW